MTMDPAQPGPTAPALGPRAYFLSDEENARIFREHILPDEFGHLGAGAGGAPPGFSANGNTARPLCILLAGQTGAGKTRTAPALVEALSARVPPRPFVHLIADTYKTYHPAYARLLHATSPPGIASAACGHDARRWLAAACAHAISVGADALVESACRNPSDFTSLATAFGEGGYRVCVALLAVHEAQSRLGVLVRWARDLPEARSRGLPLRLTPKVVHDDSYRGLVSVAEWLDSAEGGGKYVERVVVLRRGNLVGCENAKERLEDGVGHWKGESPFAAKALERERVRPGVDEEVNAFRTDLEALRQEMPDREAELAELEAMFSEGQKTGTSLMEVEPFPDLVPLHCDTFIGSG